MIPNLPDAIYMEMYSVDERLKLALRLSFFFGDRNKRLTLISSFGVDNVMRIAYAYALMWLVARRERKMITQLNGDEVHICIWYFGRAYGTQ